MWPQNFLKILVPRTPPDPPLPPLTPPRGPGGPKMAKMHSLKSIDDNLCQKSHFWGVKKIDLFFHSECTWCKLNWSHQFTWNWFEDFGKFFQYVLLVLLFMHILHQLSSCQGPKSLRIRFCLVITHAYLLLIFKKELFNQGCISDFPLNFRKFRSWKG